MADTAIPDYPRGLTFKQVWAALMEDRESMKDLDRRMDRTDREIEKTFRIVRETSRQMGLLNNRFGELAEHLVAPNIVKKFNKLGFKFDKIANNMKIHEPGNLNVVAEIDLFLENSDVTMAVEVKAKPDVEDVTDHIERMEKLRLYADRKNDKRKYYGAVAAAILSENIRRIILKKGMYVIEQSGDTMKINVPDNFVPYAW